MSKHKYLKPGVQVPVANELEAKAVIAAMVTAGAMIGDVNYHNSYAVWGMVTGEAFACRTSHRYEQITLEQALFDDAPEWATIVAINGINQIAYLEHNAKGESGKRLYINREDFPAGRFCKEHTWNEATVIATRTIEPEAYLPKVGERCLMRTGALPNIDFSPVIIKGFNGNEFWFRCELSGSDDFGNVEDYNFKPLTEKCKWIDRALEAFDWPEKPTRKTLGAVYDSLIGDSDGKSN